MNAPFLIVAGIVLVAVFIFRRALDKTSGAEGGSGTGAQGSSVTINASNTDALEGGAGGAVAGAGAGAVFGPIGIIVGAVLGAIIGLILEIEPFGNAVRAGIKEWLRDNGDKAQNGNVDGVLMRWALLRIGTVYQGPGGKVAIRVAQVKPNTRAIGNRDVIFEGFRETISNDRTIQKAAHDISESLAYRQPADLDPPAGRTRQREPYRTFKATARVGDLYEIQALGEGGPLVSVFPVPPHVPAYTVRKRPRIALTPIADKRGWNAVYVTESNVNSVCRWWDTAVGADWTR